MLPTYLEENIMITTTTRKMAMIIINGVTTGISMTVDSITGNSIIGNSITSRL
jgi:hypothetical protein